jgi:hypothetical protein
VSRDAHLVDQLVSETVIARLSRDDAANLLSDPGSGVNQAALRTESLTLAQRLEDAAEAFAAGEITRTQLRTATERLRTRLGEVETSLAVSGMPSPLEAIVGASDVRATWASLDIGRQRAVVDTVMVVTVLPATRGPVFDTTSIDIAWKT